MPESRHSPHIINARRELPRGRRLLSDIATLLLWVGWMLLWVPVWRTLLAAHRLRRDWELAAQDVVDMVTPLQPLIAIGLVLGTITLLLLWSLLPYRRNAEVPVTESLAEEALRLRVPAGMLQAGRDSRVCVVEHDDAGQIRAIRTLQVIQSSPSRESAHECD